MSERDILTQWLGRAAGRLRLNLWLREASLMACWLLCVTALYQALRAAIGVPDVIAALLPLFVLAGLGVVVLFAWRLSRRPTLTQAAAAADRHADLKDELGSALWFAQEGARGPMIDLLLERASHTVQRLDFRRLFPLVVPRGVPLAGVLALLAGVLAWLSPRVSMPTSDSASTPLSAPFQAKVRTQQANRDEPAASSQKVQALATPIDDPVRDLVGGAQTEAIAQALASRDARSAAQLLEAIRRRQAAQASAGRTARPQTEQMSDALAQDILERLKALANEDSGSQAQPAPRPDDADRSTARLERELREETQDAQRSRPGQQSAGEDALNTLLRAISRNSTGGREVVRGEAEAMQDAGRTSVGGGGAMGRRVGVSQAGGGDGEQPRSDPEGNAEAEPVLGKKTVRLAVQLQTVNVQQSADDDRNGAEDAFYAATQAQASKVEYEAVTARSRHSAEQPLSSERMPLAYRDAVKQYTLEQHRKETRGPSAGH